VSHVKLKIAHIYMLHIFICILFLFYLSSVFIQNLERNLIQMYIVNVLLNVNKACLSLRLLHLLWDQPSGI